MLNLLLADNPGITIFGFRIYAYAMVIVFGMVCAFLVISLLFKRRNMSTDLFMTYFCVTLPIALVTTRLFYCVTDGLPVSEWFSFSSIRSGGLSIIGGILGGALGVILVSYLKKVDFFRAGDCIVVGLMLAQAIGRWGNFFNQEVYGAEVTNESLQFFPFAVYINHTDGGNCFQTFTLTFSKLFNTGGGADISGGTWHYAFFFYESFFNLLGAALMFVFAWKNPKKPNGVITAWYFIQYGLVRSIMEPLRDSEYILSGGGVPWSLVTSVLMCVAGAALLAVLLCVNKKKEGVFFGSVHGDPYGITAYLKDNKAEKAYSNKVNIMCEIFPENYEEKPVKAANREERKENDNCDDNDNNEKREENKQ